MKHPVNLSSGSSADAALAAPSSDHVGNLARQGAMWTLALTIGRQVISVGSTMILARLLLPEDYGVVGMVATFTALLTATADLGLNWAVIQRRDLTMAQVHNVFWINLAIGVLLASLTYVAAPWVADFYNMPAVANVVRVTAITFILSSLAMQPLTLLRRQLAFRALTLIEMATFLVGTVVAVWLAWIGWGYWALVGQQIVTQVLRLVLAYVVGTYRPGGPSRDPATLTMLTFGGFISLSTVLNYVSGNIDNVFIGRFWGAEELGYYARAYYLMSLPAMLLTGSLAGVVQPALAALAHDRDRMGSAYRKAVHTLAVAGFPIAAGVAVTAPEAVRLIYGPGWTPVSTLLIWFSLKMIVDVVTSSIGWLFLATGNGRTMFFQRLITTSLKIVVLLIAVQYSVEAVAASVGIMFAVLFLPISWFAHRSADIPFSKTLSVLWPALAITLVMVAASLVSGMAAEQIGFDWRVSLLVKSIVGAASYAVLAFLFIRPWPLPMLERFRLAIATRVQFPRNPAS